MTLIRLPRLQMVTGGEQTKSRLCRILTKLDEFRYWKLFVRQHETHYLAALK
jgi:hypothetical protein